MPRLAAQRARFRREREYSMTGRGAWYPPSARATSLDLASCSKRSRLIVIAVRRSQHPQVLRASKADVETLASATFSKIVRMAWCSSTESPRDAGGAADAAISMARKGHLLAAAARRNQADPGFDQPHVQLKMCLAFSSRAGTLRATTQRQAKRSDHHRARTKLDRLRHLLEAARM